MLKKNTKKELWNVCKKGIHKHIKTYRITNCKEEKKIMKMYNCPQNLQKKTCSVLKHTVHNVIHHFFMC